MQDASAEAAKARAAMATMPKVRMVFVCLGESGEKGREEVCVGRGRWGERGGKKVSEKKPGGIQTTSP